MTPNIDLNAPWTLHFDRDGAEDVAIVCDCRGHDLATSRHFWRPEANDETPPTLSGMRAMAVAPQLLALAEFVAGADFRDTRQRRRAKHLARKVVAAATDDSVGRHV
jgi:hypothetical protein